MWEWGANETPNAKRGYIRVLDSYIIQFGCVLDVVRVEALGGSLGRANSH